MVRVKFKVESVHRRKNYQGDGELHTVHLTPVTSGSDENKKFYAYTPGGSIDLQCIQSAAAQFDLGEEYYVDFTKAE